MDDDDTLPQEIGLRRRVNFSPELKNEVRKVLLEHEEQGGKRRPYIVAVLEASVWVAIACAIIVYTDFMEVVQFSEYINRFYFNIGLGFISIFVAVGLYVIVWCSWINGDTEWEKVPTATFPVASFSVLAGLLCMTIGLWPLWSWFSPFIVFFIMMGFCMPFSII